MPFTFAHPAAVLPLHKLGRGRLPLVALAVGSMTPDFAYFFGPFLGGRGDNHTLLRSFTFCVPIGLLIVAVLSLLEAGWTELLPESLRPRGPIVGWTLSGLPGLALAVLLGAWTHMLWDGWTHENGWFVERIPPLQARVIGIEAHRLLQHASTAAGGAVLAWRLRHRLRLLSFDWRFGFWAVAFALSTATALARSLLVRPPDLLMALITRSVFHLVWIAFGASLLLRLIKLAASVRADS